MNTLAIAAFLLTLFIKGDDRAPAVVFTAACLMGIFISPGFGHYYFLVSGCIDLAVIFFISRVSQSTLGTRLACLSLLSVHMNFGGFVVLGYMGLGWYNMMGLAFYAVALALIMLRIGHGIRTDRDGDNLVCHSYNSN
jgi:hypothetical protein